MPGYSEQSYSPEWERIRPGIEEHAFICGMTGSGKSLLARFIVNDPIKEYSIVYDPKHSRTISAWPYQEFIYSWDELQDVGAEDYRIVYRPDLDEADDKAMQLAFFRWVYVQRHIRCYVDECSELLGETRPNRYLKGCIMRGRELGISMICTTQRPSGIPIITMSEATRLFIFRLNMPEDQQRISDIAGFSKIQIATLPPHKFLYWDAYHGRIDEPFTLDVSGLSI